MRMLKRLRSGGVAAVFVAAIVMFGGLGSGSGTAADLDDEQLVALFEELIKRPVTGNRLNTRSWKGPIKVELLNAPDWAQTYFQYLFNQFSDTEPPVFGWSSKPSNLRVVFTDSIESVFDTDLASVRHLLESDVELSNDNTCQSFAK